MPVCWHLQSLFYSIAQLFFSPKPAIIQNCDPVSPSFSLLPPAALAVSYSQPFCLEILVLITTKGSTFVCIVIKEQLFLSTKSYYGNLTNMCVYVDSQWHETSFIIIERNKNTATISNCSPPLCFTFLSITFDRFMSFGHLSTQNVKL